MAFHLTPLKTSPLTASSPQTNRQIPQPSSRMAAQQVRRPETGTPSFRSISSAAASTAPATPGATSGTDFSAAVKALFSGASSNTVSAQAAQVAAPVTPTAQSVFGDNPWLDSPTGMAPDGSIYGYNQQYFATPQTAATVAQMVGGTVVQANEMTSAPGSTFQQQQPNEMVKLKNGALINPGLVAGFYTHGYPQSMVDQMIANEVTNS